MPSPKKINRFLTYKKILLVAAVFEVLAFISAALELNSLPTYVCGPGTDRRAFIPETICVFSIILAVLVLVMVIKEKNRKQIILVSIFALQSLVVSGASIFGVLLIFGLCGLGGIHGWL